MNLVTGQRKLTGHINRLRLDISGWRHWLILPASLVILFLSWHVGPRASVGLLVMLVAGLGSILLLQRPVLGLFGIIIAALLIPLTFNTGTAVSVNPVTLMVPGLLGVWAIYKLRQRDLQFASSPVNKPLLLFLLAGLLSLFIGSVLWDPAVPRSGHFILVQLAQWAIFAFSAGALWLTGNLITTEAWLCRLTFFFIALAGGLAIIWVLPGGQATLSRFTTAALYRAPFWYLLAALVGGQLLFNKELSSRWRLYLIACLVATLFYAFFVRDDRTSYWTTIVTVSSVLIWLRYRRFGTAIIVIGLLLLASGTLFPIVYDWAGGDVKWFRSGGARIALIERTIEVTMHNPITGLGPAAYRLYGAMTPLIYEHIIWYDPRISSHNNYADLFSHVGLLGLGLFFWFMAAVARLAWHLRQRFTEGFAAGYVNGMLAAWAASLVAMMLADWFLPFVYNIRFVGFQASVLVWLFLGGLICLEQIARREDESNALIKESNEPF